jgi:phytanoyl-CoA dioxygenase PhyH
MANIRRALSTLVAHPGFTTMRLVGRFPAVRALAVQVRRAGNSHSIAAYTHSLPATSEFFPHVDRAAIAASLERDGVALGLNLPRDVVDAFLHFAANHPVWANRDPALGFHPDRLQKAQAALGRNILLAQYFNVLRECAVARRLADDPVLRWIAAQYLGNIPRLIGANLWWSYPVDASADERNYAAQVFHYDLDDFKFIKFFFYLTDVDEHSGPHVVVKGTHRRKIFTSALDRLKVRRYTDDEIAAMYPADSIVPIVGPAGTGFAEDTLAIHKGRAPASPRLTFQVQFALNDFGNQSDEADAGQLQWIPGT